MPETIRILATERIDDVALLLGVMMPIGLPELLNRALLNRAMKRSLKR